MACEKLYRSLIFSDDRKMPTLGSTTPVENSATFVSHWNIRTSSWNFLVPTEHQRWILFIFFYFRVFAECSVVNKKIQCFYKSQTRTLIRLHIDTHWLFQVFTVHQPNDHCIFLHKDYQENIFLILHMENVFESLKNVFETF